MTHWGLARNMPQEPQKLLCKDGTVPHMMQSPGKTKPRRAELEVRPC